MSFMEEFNPYEGQEGELVISFDWKGEEFQIKGLTPKHTCNDLLQKVAEELNGRNSNGKEVDGDVYKAFEYVVEFRKKQLVGTDKLKDKGMTGGGTCTYITVYHNANGGSKSVETVSIDTTTRDIKFKDHSKIPKVTGKCIIYGDKDELCAKMTECGCLISPSGMRGIINFVLNKNTFTRIYCPICYSKKKKYFYWSYEKCLYIADIQGDTRQIIAKVFHRRYEKQGGTFKVCPNCKARNRKKTGVTKYRINCAGCRKDFCFRCEKSWKGFGMLICRNEGCPTLEKQELLTDCELLDKTKSRGWVSQRKEPMPSRRACPRCYNLMMHRQACPHVKCTACGVDFCWICLTDDYYGKKKPHSWGTCTWKDRQKLG